MDDRITFRPKKEDKPIIERIRKHLKESVGADDDSSVIRFALRAADREIKKAEKP